MVQKPMSVPKKGKKSVALRSITFCSNLKEKKGETYKSIFRIFNRPIMGLSVLQKTNVNLHFSVNSCTEYKMIQIYLFNFRFSVCMCVDKK